jgi:hypothetical protein
MFLPNITEVQNSKKKFFISHRLCVAAIFVLERATFFGFESISDKLILSGWVSATTLQIVPFFSEFSALQHWFLHIKPYIHYLHLKIFFKV